MTAEVTTAVEHCLGLGLNLGNIQMRFAVPRHSLESADPIQRKKLKHLYVCETAASPNGRLGIDPGFVYRE